MVEFEVYSENPADKELVVRYWAVNDDGKFVEPVTDLLPYGNLCNSQQLVKYINEISSAWDKNRTCPRCEGYMTVRSRSEVKTKPEVMHRICDSCQESDDYEHKRLQEAEAAELCQRLNQYAERIHVATINYDAIPDDVALILIALEKAINPRLLTGSFMRDDCRRLVPGDSDKFIRRLWNAQVILDLPSKAAPGAYFLKEGKVWHYNNKVAYFLVPDTSRGKGEEAFTVLTMREYSDHKAIRQLWLDYALSDCMAYLYDQCAIHRLDTSIEDDAEVSSILRTALETFSVAQLWSVIWKIVRDAASLSAREYYNQAKAAATIPGKIKRHLEKIVKDNATLKAWTRPANQPAGTLGDVLYENFGIDEDTPGSMVMSAFADPEPETDQIKADPPAEVIENRVCTLMRQALAHNLGATAILYFADCIRSGDDAKAALEAVFAAYPVLEEPF
jgi:transcription elongation factor Elf1